MKSKLIAGIAIAAIIIANGCATAGRKLDESKIDQIKKGETTREQVIKLIGSPDQMTRSASGETTFNYSYFRATAKGTSFIPVFGAFVGGVNMQNQIFMVTFGQDGIVKDYVSTYGSSESGVDLSAGSKADVSGTETNKRPQ